MAIDLLNLWKYMLAHNDTWIVLLGIVFSLALVSWFMYFSNKIAKDSIQDALVRFVILIFSALVGVWVVDKVIAFKTNLLTEKQDNELFDLIKTLTLMIFSYYFGTKKNDRTKSY